MTTSHPSPVAAVSRVLDRLHLAASKADASTYWSLYRPDAIFFGTDASERWTLDEFRGYADPLFAKGMGWTYTPRDRHVWISADERTAWFDERLDNAKYGECRGTGVLIRDGVPREGMSEWRIAQYNLSVPIPNDLLPEVAARIRSTTVQPKP